MSSGGVPPIIVLGMHRSGTTMITGVLERLGVFTGFRVDAHRESKFFTKLSDWVLRQANASWDDPRNYRYLDRFHRSEILRVLRSTLRGPRRLEFLGPSRFLRSRSVESLGVRWAWKDPRTTFTLDLWGEIFPGAKILHVHRHPIDVAASLRSREYRQEKAFSRTLESRLGELGLAGRPLYGGSVRVRDVRRGLDLWEQYLERVSELKNDLGFEIHDIRYEEFVERPEESLDRMIEFLGLEATPERRKAAVVEVRSDRAFAFASSPELAALQVEIESRPQVAVWGYRACPTES